MHIFLVELDDDFEEVRGKGNNFLYVIYLIHFYLT